MLALTVDDLVAIAHAPRPHEELSVATGVSAIVVRVDGQHGDPVTRDLLASVPCVTVAHGRGPLAEAFDVAVTEQADLARIATTVERCPVAAVSLVLLLRGDERRTIADGLVAESTTYSMLQAGPEFLAWRAGRAVKERPPEPGPVVLVDRDGDTLRVTLNRPARHNAFSARVRDELTEALTLAVVDDGIARVVLSGNGPSFSSGGDLDEFGSFPDPAVAHAVRLTRSPARLVAQLADRVEVHLHGACMGAGIELPAFARHVIAAPDCRIALPETTLGLVPGAGGTVSLPRRIGRQRTAWLALTGATIDATTARHWGLVDELTA